MVDTCQSPVRPASRLFWAFALAAPLLGSTVPALAQVADVTAPDSQGDFTTLEIPGARGTYPQRFWLVVDRDPRGLWCRDARGRALIALRRGAVVETAGARGPLLLSQGKPYLQVKIKSMDILHDARHRERGLSTSCVVRANSAFLAPINPDSLEAIFPKPLTP